ncbi:MAG: hypothetical protein V2J62_00815 [candidate division KSB1 bacterium]|jgi:hypothetical protein|nr:hypothetical protein [candidate division KSB1 bacterium]
MRDIEWFNDSSNYRIRVAGLLDRQWSDWFAGMDIDYEDDETVLYGRVPDQSALHGLLVKIRDLNLTLISLEREKS